ncbi:hypothetical protein H6G45_00385 [Synechocystis sp. FACHB-383]|uniref:hypothetical protein n=1 Tax=Synechocystis sp. FACHB-383 TaxID=2692864 RepID=UPI00168564AE|nr:hypothetical protein [Synechocystis sp. FACHB-383]MBD2651970.1 hypothetical protein [Synechocystis sp. FACHB-383]
MAQKDNFAGGFLLGTVIGGVVGGILGSVLANRAATQSPDQEKLDTEGGGNLDSEENIELARRRLEDKIAQLNLVIDDVRDQLGHVNELNNIKEVQEEHR